MDIIHKPLGNIIFIYSLQLSDADIAILVSSKQQLQLEFHDEKERNKALSKQLHDWENKNQENLLQLRKYEKEIEDTTVSI